MRDAEPIVWPRGQICYFRSEARWSHEERRYGWGRKGSRVEPGSTPCCRKVRPGLSHEAFHTGEGCLFFCLSICLDSSNCPRVHHAEYPGSNGCAKWRRCPLLDTGQLGIAAHSTRPGISEAGRMGDAVFGHGWPGMPEPHRDVLVPSI